MPLEHDMRVKSALQGTFGRKKSSLDMNTTEQTAGLAAGAAFRHEARLYSGHDGFLAGTVPFIRAGLEADEPVLAMVGPTKIDLLREGLDGGGARGPRGMGEPIWAERGPAELVECQRHESLLNLAFADGCSMRLLCPY